MGVLGAVSGFGSALNLNIHFHLLVLDGVYELTAAGPRFRRVALPAAAELEALLGRIVTRIARRLERRGLLVRDAEHAYLTLGEVRRMTADWLRRYNGERPHEALGNLTPHEYLMANYPNPLLLSGPR